MTNTQPAEQNHNEINLGEIFGFLWRRKFRILILCILATVLGTLFVMKLPKVYEARAIVMLDEGQSNLSSMKNLLSFQADTDDQIETTIEFLKSRSFIAMVVEEYEVHLRPDYMDTISTEDGKKKVPDMQYAISNLLMHFSVSQIRTTNLLKLTIRSHDPKLAQQLVNGIIPLFLEYQKQFKQDNAEKTTNWLNTQLAELKSNLDQSESNLENYLQENKLIDVKSQINLAQTEISDLLKERYVIERKQTELSSILKQIEKKKGAVDKLIELPFFLKNPLVMEIRRQVFQQQNKLDQISKRYLHKHPKYIAVSTQLASLKDEYSNTMYQLIESVKNEREQLDKRLLVVKDNIETAKSMHSGLGKNQVDLARFFREIEANQKIYEILLTKVKENELLKDVSDHADITLIDKAAVPKNPVSPKVKLAVVLIFIVSFVASAGLQLVVYILFDKMSKFRNSIRGLDLSIIAEIPKLNIDKRKISSPISQHRESVSSLFIESIRSLRTALVTQQFAKKTKIIAVTSALPNEGKSSVALNLAYSFAELEHVLLVDADLRYPSLGDAFNLEEEHPGLTALIAQRSKFSECIHVDELSTLEVLPAGVKPRNPLAFLSKDRFGFVVKSLSKAYERVIIEAPPINTVSDALVISKVVDSVIMVVDAEKADDQVFIAAVQRLKQTGVKIEGVVLNKVKLDESQNNYSHAIRRRGMINRIFKSS